MNKSIKTLLTPNILITVSIFLLIAGVVYLNKSADLAVDHTKLPEKVEESRGFQRWLTNLRNKKYEIQGEDFILQEENEIYNTKWTTVSSIDEPGEREKFEENIEAHKNLEKVVFSPSNNQYIDYRNIARDGFDANIVHHYGLRDNKIIDSRIVECSTKTNCYFDRAYFLDNDVFVISELSRNVNKKDPNIPQCTPNQVCTYTFKVHVVDLVNNSRMIYESKPFDGIETKIIENL